MQHRLYLRLDADDTATLEVSWWVRSRPGKSWQNGGQAMILLTREEWG